jgi:DNA polymerase IV
VIGKAETVEFLRHKPVRLIWGIGPAAQESLEAAGIRTFDDLSRWDVEALRQRFGGMGERLWQLARGEDARRVSAHTPIKSISNETTFFENTSSPDILDGHIWRLSEQVSARAKARELAGQVVTLKLKRANHRILSRQLALHQPTQLADTIYRTARALFDHVGSEGPYRLLGVGISDLVPAKDADREGDLLDSNAGRRAEAERAADRIRAKFGKDAIVKGRSLR